MTEVPSTPPVQPQQPMYQPPMNFGPAPALYPQRKKMSTRTKLLIGVAVAGLLLGGASGYGIGSVGGSKAKCIEALDDADQTFALATKGFQYASDGFDAAARFSVSGLNTASAGMTDTAAEIKTVKAKYNTAETACRG